MMNDSKGWDFCNIPSYFDVLLERNGANNVINEYTWGLGLPGGIGGLLHLNQGGAHYSYIYDGKGNVTALLDSNATVAAAYQYDPFGKVRNVTGSVNQPFQFSTKPYDDKTGLSYYGYRFYVPSLGRWLTRDPLGEIGGINLYGFVGNNPVNLIDPLGLWTASVGASFTLQFGSFSATFSAGYVMDGMGNYGAYYSAGPGLGSGGRLSGGISFGGSNAKTICDLRGPFFGGNLGGGWGPNAEGNMFSGPSANGDVYGGGLTLGAGLGAGGSSNITGTIIAPRGTLW
jgi:RHS repeat-associated protein